MKSKLNIFFIIVVFCFSEFASQQIIAQSAIKNLSKRAQTTNLFSKKVNTAVKDFDFLVGEWKVHHRRIDAKSQKWVEFDGTCNNGNLTDGWVNFEEHELNAPNGTYNAIALRSYDAQTQQWTIRWLDSRYPKGPLGQGVKGGFKNNIGTFYSDFKDNSGKATRVRFVWSEITADSARWEQAISLNAGKTWETNWIMQFQRSSNALEKTSFSNSVLKGSRDFKFLSGNWQVRHQFLRPDSEDNDWLESDGTCEHLEFTNGWANLDEYFVQAPTGAYRAVALRAYNPEDKQWTIWWIDSRAPSNPIDPPVRGSFENGIGTFYSDDADDNGRQRRTRFIWSQITASTARWEQAHSYSAGKSWKTNWMMNFQKNAAN